MSLSIHNTPGLSAILPSFAKDNPISLNLEKEIHEIQPILPPLAHMLLSCHQEMDSVNARMSELHQHYLTRLQDQIQTFNLEHLNSLDHLSKTSQNEKHWNYLQQMAGSLLCMISFCVGLGNYFGETGIEASKYLITTGILGISQLLMNYSNGLDTVGHLLALENEEHKKKLRLLLSFLTTVGILSAGFYGTQFALQQSSHLIQFQNISQGVMKLGQGYVSYEKCSSQQSQIQAEKNLKLKEEELEAFYKTIENFLISFQKNEKAIIDSAKKIKEMMILVSSIN